MQQAPALDADGKQPGTGAVTSDNEGKWQYPYSSHTGAVKIEIPLKNAEPGKETESVLACNFGPHVAAKIEADFKSSCPTCGRQNESQRQEMPTLSA